MGSEGCRWFFKIVVFFSFVTDEHVDPYNIIKYSTINTGRMIRFKRMLVNATGGFRWLNRYIYVYDTYAVHNLYCRYIRKYNIFLLM
jgi:hypothetical protein